MSVLQPTPGEIFSLRTFKSFEGYRWVNTYEFRCESETATLNDLQNVARQVCEVERAPLANAMRIYKATVSTYVPDSQPYNPDTFVTINMNFQGAANFGVETIPLTVCVFARKNTVTGRPGKFFFRGYLSENDVYWGGDSFEIIPRRIRELDGALNQLVSAFRPTFSLVLAYGAPDPVNVREVTSISVVTRTSFKKMNNRYFDVRERE